MTIFSKVFVTHSLGVVQAGDQSNLPILAVYTSICSKARGTREMNKGPIGSWTKSDKFHCQSPMWE